MSKVYLSLFESIETKNQTYVIKKATNEQKSQIIATINIELMETIWNKFSVTNQFEILKCFDRDETIEFFNNLSLS